MPVGEYDSIYGLALGSADRIVAAGFSNVHDDVGVAVVRFFSEPLTVSP